MVKQVTAIYKRRGEQKLCMRCGKRPQFWCKRCVICRQVVAKDPLPRGAREALRRFRAREAKCLQENSREKVRVDGRRLIAGGTLTEREAEALQLYLGLEDDGWRTYKQVAQLMQVTAERVRQLLLPSKAALALSLAEKIPWRSARRTPKNRARLDSMIGDASFSSENTQMESLGGEVSTSTRVGRLVVLMNALFREIEPLAGNHVLDESARLQPLFRSDSIDLYEDLRRFEVNLIKLALIQTGGNQARAAKLLNLKPQTLNAKIKLYGIEYVCR